MGSRGKLHRQKEMVTPMHIRTYFRVLTVVLLGLVVFPSLAYTSYGASDSLDIQVNLGNVFYLDASPDPLVWTVEDTSYLDYINGYSMSKNIEVILRANVGWKLYIEGTSEYWGIDPNPSWDKPCTDLQWIGSTYPYYMDVRWDDPELVTQNPNPKTSGLGPGINIRFKLSWVNDVPGYYQYNDILLTLTEF